MRPLKAALFVVFCLFSIAAVGTAFSHLWRTQKLLNQTRGDQSAPVQAPVPDLAPDPQ